MPLGTDNWDWQAGNRFEGPKSSTIHNAGVKGGSAGEEPA